MATGQKVKVNVRGRVVTRTVPAKTVKKPAAKAADWFSKLSKTAQAAYIKAHPNSKYAKGAKSKVAPAPNVSKAAVKPDAASIATKALTAQIKVLQEKVKATDNPKTKAKLLAQIAVARAHKKSVKDISAKGKGISVTYAGGKVTEVKGPSRAGSTTRKLSSIAAKAKAHETKRAADKNKVVAKTPTAKESSLPNALTLTRNKVKATKEKLTKLKPGGAAHKKVSEELKMLNARLRFQRGKVKNGYAAAPVKVKPRVTAAVKKVVRKTPVKELPKGRKSIADSAKTKARIQAAIRKERAKLKDTKPGSASYKRIESDIKSMQARLKFYTK